MLGAIGTFGKLPFICSHEKVLTFSDLTKETASRWAKHEVVGAKPVIEYLGEDLERISFKIRFDSSMGMPPVAGLLALKKMRQSHESQILIIGGEYFGKYVIESITEDRRFHSGAGVCIVAEATISLTEVA